MCYHNQVVCKDCGSKEWLLFQGNNRCCSDIELKCKKCNRVISVEIQKDNTKDVDVPIRYYSLRDKKLEDLTPDDIPRGLDPNDLAEDPERYVQI